MLLFTRRNVVNDEVQVRPGEAVYGEVRALLERRRDRLCEEIMSYTAPIPACDVHFNRLLEERDAAFADLDRLAAISARGSGGPAALAELVAQSGAIGEAEKARVAGLLARTADKAGERS